MFAKKIEGEELKNLVETLGGIGFDSAYLNYKGPSTITSSYGKLNVSPSKKGLTADLEIFVKERELVGVVPSIFYGIGQITKLNKKTFQIKKAISYDELRKLNLIEAKK